MKARVVGDRVVIELDADSARRVGEVLRGSGDVGMITLGEVVDRAADRTERREIDGQVGPPRRVTGVTSRNPTFDVVEGATIRYIVSGGEGAERPGLHET